MALKDKDKRLTIISEVGTVVRAMYDPSEFSLEMRNQFQRTVIPGLPVPVTQFVSGEARKLSFDLFFDTSETKEDVRNHTRQVIGLLKIDKTLHAPPVCTFEWGGGALTGENISFTGVIDSAIQKFTMFHDTGIPIRATVSISVTEYRTIQEQLDNIRLESADHTKRRLFREGDSLWFLSHKEYNDPALWREIARRNKIANPRLVDAGTELLIPPLV